MTQVYYGLYVIFQSLYVFFLNLNFLCFFRKSYMNKKNKINIFYLLYNLKNELIIYKL